MFSRHQLKGKFDLSVAAARHSSLCRASKGTIPEKLSKQSIRLVAKHFPQSLYLSNRLPGQFVSEDVYFINVMKSLCLTNNAEQSYFRPNILFERNEARLCYNLHNLLPTCGPPKLTKPPAYLWAAKIH